MRPTRRQLLLASVATAGACTTSRPRPVPPNPDVPLVSDAVARERSLLAAYDLVLTHATSPELQAFRADHAAHLTALGGATTPSASVTPLPLAIPTPPLATPSAQALRTLAELERAAAHDHVAAALRASPSLAPLLASLAACESSHGALL